MTEVKSFIGKKSSEKLLKTLVEINTVNPSGNEKNLVDLILNLLKSDFVDMKVIDHGHNRASLVAKIQGKSPKGIAFIGHIDTVPEGDGDKWEFPPFQGVVKDGFMYGRGTCDMKGGVTAMIIAAQYFIDNRINPPRDVYFCFTADEESGGMGIKAIRKSNILKDVTEVFICEPTGEKLGIAEKGAIWVNLKAKGKQCHGAMPNKGINAIENLMEFIDLVKSKVHKEHQHELLGPATFALTTIDGGVKTNIIPDFAEATLDIRTLPGVKNEDIIKMFNDLVEKFNHEGNRKIEIEITNDREPLEISRNHEFVKKILDVYKDLNHEREFTGILYYTDASQLIPYMDVPFIILGPGDETMPHQMDERIFIKSIDKMAEVYINYIRLGEKS